MRVFRARQRQPQRRIAVDARSVDWGNYDAVVCINIPLPSRLVLRYPRTLFAYMVGEANILSKRKHFGYDVVLNQMARGGFGPRRGAIDFPYTFLNGRTLERLVRKSLQRDSKKRGVFMEINSTSERPVTQPPAHFLPLIEAGLEINLHRQMECSPKTDPGVMRVSGAERRKNSHETEKTHTGRNHQKAA